MSIWRPASVRDGRLMKISSSRSIPSSSMIPYMRHDSYSHKCANTIRKRESNERRRHHYLDMDSETLRGSFELLMA